MRLPLIDNSYIKEDIMNAGYVIGGLLWLFALIMVGFIHYGYITLISFTIIMITIILLLVALIIGLRVIGKILP